MKDENCPERLRQDIKASLLFLMCVNGLEKPVWLVLKTPG